MTDHPAKEIAKRAGRSALGPLSSRIDFLRRDVADLRREFGDLTTRQDAVAASTEQVHAVVGRLEAYVDRVAEELRSTLADLERRSEVARSVGDELGGVPADAGATLRERFDHGLLHAEALVKEARADLARQVAELRSTVRLTQALVERSLDEVPAASDRPADGEGGDASVAAPSPAAATREPVRSYRHPAPSFDLLYRTFEDRHRGTQEEIRRRQREDYLDLLRELPNPEMPVADLGCGRGELVALLDGEGVDVLGVDENAGQVDEAGHLVEQANLFDWLDERDAGTVRAVTALHVVEHLPLDLQVRLVFEAFRVLAPGGLIVFETPNSYSLSTAATNFWVDPTHQRPIHPLFLEFLAVEAGYVDVELRPLHELGVQFAARDEAAGLAGDLERLLFGHGDIALIARRSEG